MTAVHSTPAISTVITLEMMASFFNTGYMLAPPVTPQTLMQCPGTVKGPQVQRKLRSLPRQPYHSHTHTHTRTPLFFPSQWDKGQWVLAAEGGQKVVAVR